jgi:cell division septum initiation protein DivIVA
MADSIGTECTILSAFLSGRSMTSPKHENDIIKAIVKAEKEAQASQQKAKQEAEQILNKARQEARLMVERSQTFEVEKISNTSSDEQEIEAIKKRTSAELQHLAPKAQARFRQAIDEAIHLVIPT